MANLTLFFFTDSNVVLEGGLLEMSVVYVPAVAALALTLVIARALLPRTLDVVPQIAEAT